MAQIEPNTSSGPSGPSGPGRAVRARGRAARYGVPAAVAGIAAATIGLVPALAATGDPDLPKITAKELVAKLAASEVEQVSGTVKVRTDLGLPSLAGLPGMGSGGAGEGEKSGAADPQARLMTLLSGEHTLRVAADGPQRQRVSVLEDAAEYSVIRNGDEVWTYDSASDSASRVRLPEGAGEDAERKEDRLPRELTDLTPQEAADRALDAVDETTSVSVDGTAKVAGRDAYQLVIEPKGATDSTVEDVRIAVDADNGAPLKFTLTPSGGGKPVVDIAWTDVDFAKPDAKTFDFTPPKGTDVTERKLNEGDLKDGLKKGESHKGAPDKGAPDKGAPSGVETLGEGWGTVLRLEGPKGMPGGDGGRGGDDADALLDTFTEKVKGDFGTGRLVETRLVNALLTDDGTVYVGAVTKDGLVAAADGQARR